MSSACSYITFVQVCKMANPAITPKEIVALWQQTPWASARNRGEEEDTDSDMDTDSEDEDTDSEDEDTDSEDEDTDSNKLVKCEWESDYTGSEDEDTDSDSDSDSEEEEEEDTHRPSMDMEEMDRKLGNALKKIEHTDAFKKLGQSLMDLGLDTL